MKSSGNASVSRARAWFAVAVLCLAQIVSTIDRGMLALVIDPVRADLGISEVQIAMLQGLAFAIFYVSVGIPLGFVADALNRRWLLVSGIVVWSSATVFSGLAASFGQMFAARLAIGVGEAALGPCAVGMIGEMFPANFRGRPMSLYVLGSMIAYGMGSALTGLILQAAPMGTFSALPLIGDLAPWRIAFVLVGLSGFPVAGLLLLLHNQGDTGQAGGSAMAREGAMARLPALRASAAATLALLHAGRRIYLPLYAAVALFATGGSVASGWSAVLLTRQFGASPAQAGQGLGVAQIVWALGGALLAGVVVDKVGARFGASGKIAFAGVLALVALPSCLGVIAPGYGWALALGAEVMFASAVFGTTMLSVIADIIPQKSRGVAVALYAFVMTMIGGSLGPLAVAGLTEHVFGSPAAVGRSMAVVGSFTLLASALLAMLAARRHAALSVD